jgi:hypothetical protein
MSGPPIALRKTKKLFVVSEGDTIYSQRASKLAADSSEPKRSVVLPGHIHMIYGLSNKTFSLRDAIIEMLSRE